MKRLARDDHQRLQNITRGRSARRRVSMVRQRARRPLTLEPLESRTFLAADLQEGMPEGLLLDTSSYDASSIVVRTEADMQLETLLQQALPGAHLAGQVQLVSGLYKVGLPSGLSVQAAISAIAPLRGILSAHPNYHLALDQTDYPGEPVYPNDPGFSSLWGMHNTGQWSGKIDADIDAPEAWGITTGDPSVVVAVLDTGIDYWHADLATNVWTNPGEIPGDGIDNDGNGYIDDVRGWDFYNGDNNPMDDHGHGTHVAGTIAAIGDNGIGVAGVAWNVKVMPIKIFSASGTGTAFDAILGLDYAVRMGASVSNNSYQMYGMYDAIAAAGQSGHIFIASAGNSGQDSDSIAHYPSSYTLDNIISVAATDRNDNIASWSNYGATTVDLGAPGVNIYSSLPGGGYGGMSGTSMSSPHVTGTVALVRSLQPQWSIAQVKHAILDTVDPVASLAGITLTGGRLNAAAAVAAAVPPSDNEPTGGDDADIQAGLLAWWNFNEGTGEVAADTSLEGENHPGTLIGDTAWAPMGLDHSLQFDGSGDMLAVPDSSSINIATVTRRTISLWFAATDVSKTAGRQVVYEEGGAARGLNIYVDSGRLYVGGWNEPSTESGWDGTFLSTDQIQSRQWHHVVLVLSGGTTVQAGAIRAYLDGVEFGRGVGSQLWSHGDDTGIGHVAQWSKYHTGEASTAGNGFAGLIDEVRIYNRVLSDGEIGILSQQQLLMPAELDIQLSEVSVVEGAAEVEGTVTRWGDLSDALTVTLVSSDTSEATVPGSVTIAAGETQATFIVTPVDDALSDGTQRVAITGTAAGYHDATAFLEILDDEPATVGLVAHWQFDEASGSLVADTSELGLDNSGILGGGATRVEQGMVRSLQFSGNGQYVAIPDSTDINLRVVSQRTVSLWFLVDDASIGWRKQVLFEEGGTTRGLNMYVDGGSLYVGGWNTLGSESNWSGTFLSTDQIQAGQWHHVALVLSGGVTVQSDAMTGYLDGLAFGSGAGSQLWLHGDDTGIGQVAQWSRYHTGEVSTDGNGFAGLIDEVRIYNRALQSHEIAALAGEPMTTLEKLTVSIMADSISEQGGSSQVTVTRSGDTAGSLVVTLESSATDQAVVPSTVTIAAGQPSATFTVTAVDDAVRDGNQIVSLTASAADMARGIDSLQVIDDERVLVQGVASDVSNGWQTITLPQEYASMVVIATPSYTEQDVPVVTRIRQAAGNSFQLRVDRTDRLTAAVPGVTVHYVVAEEGIYTLARDGVKMEAVKYDSTVTDGQGNWVGETRLYGQAYQNPAVFGQVQSYNDADFSVFWSCGAAAADPASSNVLHVGKHIGEDPDKTRATEKVGYLVLESGTTIVQDMKFVVGVGAATIYGMGNTPPYTYALGGLSAASVAVAGLAGMYGDQGGWAVLYGVDPVNASRVQLAADEDQAADEDRVHVGENVSYLVFEDSALTLQGDWAAEGTAAEVTLESVEALLGQALALWDSAADRSLDAAIDRLEVQIRDLPSRTLARLVDDALLVDVDAAGAGWFLDPTPAEHEEFACTAADDPFIARSESPASRHVDLLSVLAHELGHLLGHGHERDDPHHVMSRTLPIGQRRLPPLNPDELDSHAALDQSWEFGERE